LDSNHIFKQVRRELELECFNYNATICGSLMATETGKMNLVWRLRSPEAEFSKNLSAISQPVGRFARFYSMRMASISGIAMRKLNLLLVCSTLAAEDLETLRQLMQDKRFFELRRELQHSRASTSETLFYRGVVASRFGREEEGIGLLQEFLATNPARELALQGQQEISAAWVRLGRYSEAIRNSPEGDPLIASLRNVRPESVEILEGPAFKATG
jgi:hypothetical protein